MPKMTVGELTLRGCYLGSNVSYNVKKMVENGYLAHERSVHDRRSIHVRLTEKGITLRDSLTVMHQRHAEMLSPAALSGDDLQATSVTLRRLERFWLRAADLVQPRQPLPLIPVLFPTWRRHRYRKVWVGAFDGPYRQSIVLPLSGHALRIASSGWNSLMWGSD